MIPHIHDLIVEYGRKEVAYGQALADPDGDAGTTSDAQEEAHQAFVLLEQAIDELRIQDE